MINKIKVINFNYLKLNNLVKEKVYNSMAIQSKIVNTFDLSLAWSHIGLVSKAER